MEYDKVNDSGAREDMETGSRRDTQVGKGRHDLLPVWVTKRDAVHLENGAAKYGDGNWLLGQKSSRYCASMYRHILAYMEGDRSEDHLAAVRWNAAGIMTNEIFVERGIYDDDIHDMNDFTCKEGFDETIRVKVEADNERLRQLEQQIEPSCDYMNTGCGDCRIEDKICEQPDPSDIPVPGEPWNQPCEDPHFVPITTLLGSIEEVDEYHEYLEEVPELPVCFGCMEQCDDCLDREECDQIICSTDTCEFDADCNAFCEEESEKSLYLPKNPGCKDCLSYDKDFNSWPCSSCSRNRNVKGEENFDYYVDRETLDC